MDNLLNNMSILNDEYKRNTLVQQHAGSGGAYEIVNDDHGRKMGVNISSLSVEASNPSCVLFDFLIEAVLMGTLCLFGFTGNTLSMICLMKDRSRTATPFLLVSLEVADTLFLITVLLARVIPSLHTMTLWLDSVMVVYAYVGIYIWPTALIAETMTIYLTILVTVNRYISVCRPYEASDLCSIRHARSHVVIIVIMSIIYNVPRYFEYDAVVMYVHPETNHTISKTPLSAMGRHMVYQIVYANALYFLVLFLIPLVLLVIMNYKLIQALRDARNRRAQILSKGDRENSKSEDDITLILIVVVVIFVVCQTPALVTQTLLSILPMNKRVCPNPFFYYERISDMLVVTNSSINFIVYCFCSTKFRTILIDLLCKKNKRPAVDEYNTVIAKDKATQKEKDKSGGSGDSMV